MSSNDPTVPADPAAPDFAAPVQYPAPAGAAAPTSGAPTWPPAHPAYPAQFPSYGPPTAYDPVTPTPAPYGAPAYPVQGGPDVLPARALASVAPERVGRGLLFSLGGIVVGVVLTVVLWQLNFIASVTSFAMAYSAIWLYVRGAGRAPARGAAGVIGVILLGVVACLASVIASDTLAYLGEEYPDAPGPLRFQAVVESLLAPEVWGNYTREILMYLLFAGLGTFGLIRQLGRARRAR